MEKQSVVVSDKKKCFACNETSHSLDQCRIKYKLVSVAQLFGHATRFPFFTIQPSEEAVDKEKFYHHCLLITSNISNLDPTKVKDELQKSWKLSSDWELRRECRKNFVASFDSENDLISCLKNPMMETYLDGEEVKFTVTRWTDGESVELNRQWFSVRGVPRIYRNWKELYQVASAFGVLIGVDEESLEFGDTEPIRLKIALRNFDDAPLSSFCVWMVV
jgi:translation initiation factor 4A